MSYQISERPLESVTGTEDYQSEKKKKTGTEID